MALEITPEPTPEEREAIARALDSPDGPAAGSAWWEAGLRESVEEPEDG